LLRARLSRRNRYSQQYFERRADRTRALTLQLCSRVPLKRIRGHSSIVVRRSVRFACDSPLEGDGFELVWGFPSSGQSGLNRLAMTRREAQLRALLPPLRSFKADESYASHKVSNVINVIDDIRILLDNISEGL